MSNQLMAAPSTIVAGSVIDLPDGSQVTVDANGYALIPMAFVSDMLNSGFTIEVGLARGHIYYVSSLVTASGGGSSWATAFKTITEAVAVAVAGDTIYIYSGAGTAHQFAESVSVAVGGLRIIGAGSGPDEAVWTGSGAAALTITAVEGCLVQNIRFRPANGYAGISLVGASSYTTIQGCRFQGQTGSLYGIVSDGRQSGVRILNNTFLYMNVASNGAGIYAPIYGTTAENAAWLIAGNDFHSNTRHIKGNFRYTIIRDNTFAGNGLIAAGSIAAPDKCVDLTVATGSVGCNMVTRNTLGGLYTTALYVAATNDCWFGNFCNITTTTAPVTAISALAPTS
jgi:hypothetical protein